MIEFSDVPSYRLYSREYQIGFSSCLRVSYVVVLHTRLVLYDTGKRWGPGSQSLD